jgi:hypothetical protein
MTNRYLALLAALAAFSGCTLTRLSEAPEFAVYPYGHEGEQLIKRESQKGSGIGPALLRKDLVEVTIAQGSGGDGFDGLRVFGDGTAYAFFGKPESGAENEKRNFQLSEDELAGLVSAINRDRVARIAGATQPRRMAHRGSSR